MSQSSSSSTEHTDTAEEPVTPCTWTFSAVIHAIPLGCRLLLGLDVGKCAVNIPAEEDVFHPASPEVLDVADFTSHRSFRNAYLYHIRRVMVCRPFGARASEFVLVEYAHAWFPREPRWLFVERASTHTGYALPAWLSWRSISDAPRADGEMHDRVLLARTVGELERLRGLRPGGYKMIHAEELCDSPDPPTIKTLGNIIVSLRTKRPVSQDATSLWYAETVCEEIRTIAHKANFHQIVNDKSPEPSRVGI